ncbi:MAG: Thymidylate synthase complementing protein [Chlorobi bacterium]|nr:Thymidylate synthase complementing protein [Chlorobiota bacterium]
MNVTQVAIRPTEASNNAGRPALTPELLAASGARYSRSNEGLEAILSKIDPENLDKSVDSIFRMIDYGHQSIADMAPVAMFIDGISLWLAYYVWTLCPTAGGQESSTRYIRLSADEMTPPSELGIAAAEEWKGTMERCFNAYRASLEVWEEIAAHDPDVARIPRSLLDDPSPKAARQVARMKRNYAFDRARYFLPVAASTNMMMIMSARGWVTLCQSLLSHPLPEAAALGRAVCDELRHSAPRMLKHAARKESHVNGIAREFESWRGMASSGLPEYLTAGNATSECPPRASLDLMLPNGISEHDFAADLAFHDNRYSWVGESLKRTAVRFAWDAVTLGEIRDLNRHRTGTKYCPLVPRGFYAALEQMPENIPGRDDYLARLRALNETGREISAKAHDDLRNGDPGYIYSTLLGTQYLFEHVTTADKFIYEAELRTGTGAHYRYALHLHDTLALWYARFPATREFILEGSAEPE